MTLQHRLLVLGTFAIPRGVVFKFRLLQRTLGTFIHDALSRVSPIPVVKMPLALGPDLEVVPNLTRKNFGLPIDSFMLLSILDFASVLERKIH